MAKTRTTLTEPHNVRGTVTSQCPGWIRTCTPFAVVLSVVALLTIGFWVFPAVKSMIHYQDCVASGRVDCASAVTTDN